MLNRETDLQRIGRKTGRKQSSCKCVECKSQCRECVCLGTPSDIEKIIDDGHGDKIKKTDWASGIILGVTQEIIPMYQAELIKGKGCTFFENGLCMLHESGLKPTEGKLSHHSTKRDNYDMKKSVTWAVAKEWLRDENMEIIFRIMNKLK